MPIRYSQSFEVHQNKMDFYFSIRDVHKKMLISPISNKPRNSIQVNAETDDIPSVTDLGCVHYFEQIYITFNQFSNADKSSTKIQIRLYIYSVLEI